MKTLKLASLTLGLIFSLSQAMAFCGFYVAKADAQLFNEASEIILVRDGDRTVVTMSNDFKGDVKDFAMVVPVPEVLKRENIRIAKRSIFDQLNGYSAPRLVEYHDNDPCRMIYPKAYSFDIKMPSNADGAAKRQQEDDKEKAYGVKIEATYAVGEYDILILSAKESTGLQAWLTDNDYKIPTTAEEVLEPYIKSNMKFFVVKVNIDRLDKGGFTNLNPIQIAFESDKFMLPIRLGMANSNGDQDMVVYAFTKTGRVEVANYRTVQIPTDKNIPEFIQPKFGNFYTDLFHHSWEKEGENAVFLEYAWDLSSSNFVKCDPCSTTPPDYQTLREAGVYWVESRMNRGGGNYNGDLHFTRLHVRYNRKHFPQDLLFVATPNKQRFQGRYIMQRALKYELTCDAANDYYRMVKDRRQQELITLASLTGWDPAQHQGYVKEFANKVSGGWIENDFDNNTTPILPTNSPSDGGQGPGPISYFFLLGVLATGAILLWMNKAKRSLQWVGLAGN